MAQRSSKHLWILVYVYGGIPVTVEAYSRKKDAEKRERYYRKEMNPENDETGIFCVAMPSSKKAPEYQ